MHELITILGPTATGKTGLAAALAAEIDAEIISADSRQVYRGMDLGTGKDIEEYTVEGKEVPHHLIDIADPGDEYNVYSFQKDFLSTFEDITQRGKKTIMCGGSGMYLESVILAYDMSEAPRNEALRKELETLSDKELVLRLQSLREVHNTTDLETRERLIRAIEIEECKRQKDKEKVKIEGGVDFPEIQHHVFGISLPREDIRSKITYRLMQRLEDGMVDEVKSLLESGVTPEQLEFYGLEYKFLTQFASGTISYNDMFQRLNSAIHQFAKRQMTWFRRMEKKGVNIIWIDGKQSLPKKLKEINKHLKSV